MFGLRVGVVAVVVCLCNLNARAEFMATVEAGAQSRPYLNAPWDPHSPTVTDLSGGAKSIEISGYSETSNLDEPGVKFINGYAGMSGWAFVGPGVVKARIDGLAYVASPDPNVPILTNDPWVQGSLAAGFTDTLHVSHPTLPAGSPVTLEYVFDVSGTSNGPGNNYQYTGWNSGTLGISYNVGGTGAYYYWPNGLTRWVPTSFFDEPIVVQLHTVVGAEVNLNVGITMSLDDRAGPNTGVGFYDRQETHIHADHSLYLYVDSLTPGVVLTSDSGFNYSIAAPEPASAAILLSLAAASGARRRRRAGAAA